MKASDLVEILIGADESVCARTLLEASVHRGTRTTRWVGVYRDEHGRIKWRSTGVRDKPTALRIVKKWENQAKRRRLAQAPAPRKPSIRIRQNSGERELGLLSQREVALILKISERSVRAIEVRAFRKIRDAMHQFWTEFTTGELSEMALPSSNCFVLSRAELKAVYGMTRNSAERNALTKLLTLMRSKGA